MDVSIFDLELIIREPILGFLAHDGTPTDPSQLTDRVTLGPVAGRTIRTPCIGATFQDRHRSLVRICCTRPLRCSYWRTT